MPSSLNILIGKIYSHPINLTKPGYFYFLIYFIENINELWLLDLQIHDPFAIASKNKPNLDDIPVLLVVIYQCRRKTLHIAMKEFKKSPSNPNNSIDNYNL